MLCSPFVCVYLTMLCKRCQDTLYEKLTASSSHFHKKCFRFSLIVKVLAAFRVPSQHDGAFPRAIPCSTHNTCVQLDCSSLPVDVRLCSGGHVAYALTLQNVRVGACCPRCVLRGAQALPAWQRHVAHRPHGVYAFPFSSGRSICVCTVRHLHVRRSGKR